MKPKSTFLARKALASPTLLQGRPGGDEVATVRACKCPPMAAISAQQAGHRVAAGLLRHGLPKWTNKTLIYLDPPYYYERGRELYYDYYQPKNHADLATFIRANMNPYSPDDRLI